MRVTIDGIPATLEVPDGYRVADAVIICRIVADGNPRDDTLIMGVTDHTGGLIADMLLEAAPFAPDTADMTDEG